MTDKRDEVFGDDQDDDQLMVRHNRPLEGDDDQDDDQLMVRHNRPLEGDDDQDGSLGGTELDDRLS